MTPKLEYRDNWSKSYNDLQKNQDSSYFNQNL